VHRPPTPLADAVAAYLASGPAPFSTPGHKRAPHLIGEDPLLAADLPLSSGADDLAMTGGLLQQAEALAAHAWGADWTRFSVNGSTHPNQALCLAAAGPGERAIVARTSHKSIFAGLVLAGIEPVWVLPDVDPATGLALGVRASEVEAALTRAPDARAVILVEPSWLGLISDIGAIAALAAQRGAALICDQAWGAHFGFHPQLPPTALALGADAISISVHKTLTSFTQGAMLHAADRGRLSLERLGAAYDALATTSPSAAILASLDRARALLEGEGERLLDDALRHAASARAGLGTIAGLRVLGDEALASESVAARDPLKLVVDLAGTGADGLAVEADLRAAGVHLEGADRSVLLPLLTIGDDEATIERLVRAVHESLERRAGTASRPHGASTAWRVAPEQALTPRAAFFAPHERVPAARAAGRIAAEVAAPYPPGIPALAPGEVIGAELLDELRAEAAAGTRIAGVGDPTLETLLVVS